MNPFPYEASLKYPFIYPIPISNNPQIPFYKPFYVHYCISNTLRKGIWEEYMNAIYPKRVCVWLHSRRPFVKGLSGCVDDDANCRHTHRSARAHNKLSKQNKLTKLQKKLINELKNYSGLRAQSITEKNDSFFQWRKNSWRWLDPDQISLDSYRTI